MHSDWSYVYLLRKWPFFYILEIYFILFILRYSYFQNNCIDFFDKRRKVLIGLTCHIRTSFFLLVYQSDVLSISIIASLSICQPISLMFCLCGHWYTFLSIFLSISVTVFLFVCLSDSMPVYLYVCLCSGLSMCLFVCMSVCVSVCLSVYLLSFDIIFLSCSL